jgi:hypothetical protein
MDVARIMIRTSCQIVVDEFLDVKINDEVFQFRILEDSYGPMRIPLPQNQSLAEKVNTDDEDEEEEEEEEEAEEEEEERRLLMGEEDQERESVGEGEYSNAFNSHNEPIISLINNVQNLKDKENREEVSFNSINHAPNLNQPVLTLIEIGGSTSKQGGTAQQNSLV